MKSIVIVTIVSVIVSIGIYKGIRKVLYKRDVTNKASFARLIKYVLVFINSMIFLDNLSRQNLLCPILLHPVEWLP